MMWVMIAMNHLDYFHPRNCYSDFYPKLKLLCEISNNLLINNVYVYKCLHGFVYYHNHYCCLPQQLDWSASS